MITLVAGTYSSVQVCISVKQGLLDETDEATAGHQGQLRKRISEITIYV